MILWNKILFIFCIVLTQSLHSRVHPVDGWMRKCWCGIFRFEHSHCLLFVSPWFLNTSLQMARRQTSQREPMKTSISSRVLWNCTSGICQFLSSHSKPTPSSSKLQVRHSFADQTKHMHLPAHSDRCSFYVGIHSCFFSLLHLHEIIILYCFESGLWIELLNYYSSVNVFCSIYKHYKSKRWLSNRHFFILWFSRKNSSRTHIKLLLHTWKQSKK